MSKRSAAVLQSHATHAYSKASRPIEKHENLAMDEIGEFEDAWEDELESDEDVVDAEVDEHKDGACLR
jgi:ribosome assembly protein RRB1